MFSKDSRGKGFAGKVSMALLLAAFVAAGSLVLAGCSQPTDPDYFDRQFVPVGSWESHWDDGASGGIDTYTITKGKLTYSTVSFYGSSTWGGDIEAAVDFSKDSGVLIIKYVTPPSGTGSGVHGGGYNYTAVYYQAYSSTSIKAADAWIPADPFPEYRAEAQNLNDALDLFTAGNAGTHVSTYGTYTK
jgi:hypothetical protein